jgi:hypothetical protein
MLQRLLTASGEVLVWGESGGGLNDLAQMVDRYAQMNGPGSQRFPHGLGGNGAEQFARFRANPQEAANEWIASMNPPQESLLEHVRRLLTGFYAEPARELGFPRWGVKEVQCGTGTAMFLRSLWPDGRFVFLVRHPMHCLLSIKRRNWIDQPEHRDPVDYFCRHWVQLAREFREASIGRLVYYEKLIAEPAIAEELFRYLGISRVPANFVAEKHADWRAENQAELTFTERRRARRILGEEMQRHGYGV